MKCIIFDKDGTLLDFNSFWYPVAQKAAEYICSFCNCGKELQSEIIESFGFKDKNMSITGSLCYGTYKDISASVSSVLENNKIDFDKKSLVSKVTEAFENCSHFGKIAPTSENLKVSLENLKSKGAKLFVVTSDNFKITKYCLESLGIFELFEEVLTSDEVHPSKPDPYYIEYIYNKYGFVKKDMCMIGDTVADMKFAINGGIDGYAVGTSQQNLDILAPMACGTAENIEELIKKYEI